MFSDSVIIVKGKIVSELYWILPWSYTNMLTLPNEVFCNKIWITKSHHLPCHNYCPLYTHEYQQDHHKEIFKEKKQSCQFLISWHKSMQWFRPLSSIVFYQRNQLVFNWMPTRGLWGFSGETVRNHSKATCTAIVKIWINTAVMDAPVSMTLEHP